MLDNSYRREKEKLLADLLKKNDQHALAGLYDAYAPVLLGLINRIVKDKDAAEMVLQKTFLQIWNQRFTYDPDKKGLLTWMILLAKDAAIAEISPGRSRNFATNPESQQPAPENAAESGAVPGEIPGNEILCRLKPVEKAALELVYLKGYPCREAAAALGIPENTLILNLKMAIKQIGAATAS